ncbi:MAG: bifunctional UDP-N-acetylglucosamine diphosphorylase/glucosamine-1-phosphate N-acetyltransferase GlmU [Coriobacteriales bacterium]|nr:bifunctional UDP-N-acetylglucosamine diphosphorylase/glucosamine-1-phosphate N-acetyltransferase GlmU [Coriobacteriales bacterium]
MAFSTLILAAGAGTRMKSEKPKVAHEILGKPLLRWAIDAAWAAGSNHVFTVLGHNHAQTAPLAFDTEIIYQDKLLGTGHAVLMARPALEPLDGDDIVVMSGDTPLLLSQTITQLAERRAQSGAAACLLTFETANPSGYGRIIRDWAPGATERAPNKQAGTDRWTYEDAWQHQGDRTQDIASDTPLVSCPAFRGIVEERDANTKQRQIREVNGGVYCFERSSLFSLLQQLRADNAQKEYYLPDVLTLMVQTGLSVEVIRVVDASELRGINDRIQLAEVQALAQQRVNQRLMRAGVTIFDPKSVWIGPDVELSHDVEILPFTTLTGQTKVGWGTIIGPSSRVNNSTIGQSCVVDESVLIDVILEDRVSVGPRAYLRPGTVMRAGSHAGSHVEIKKSEIGAGSKVPHLSYIGDARLGSEVNIGAGSITCNYDGVHKNPTIIGDRSFIGSDTMLVAPVQIGADSVTGAGSVITNDVPSGTLAIARPPQTNVANWTKRQRKRPTDSEKNEPSDKGANA